jgi:hypothetical protein
MGEPVILTAEQLSDGVCRAIGDTSKVHLNRDGVPLSLRPIVHYAEFWGRVDDWERGALLRSAGEGLRRNLKDVVIHYEEPLEEWLLAVSTDSGPLSDEFVAFTAMLMAADCLPDPRLK